MSYFALVPKEKALNKDYRPNNDNRTDWLTLPKFDEMICESFGVEVDPKYYYGGWKDFLYWSQAKTAMSFIGTSRDFHVFEEYESYIKLYALCCNSSISAKTSMDEMLKNIKTSYDSIKEGNGQKILHLLYHSGYVLVGVFNE